MLMKEDSQRHWIRQHSCVKLQQEKNRVKVTHRVNDAAESLKDEHRCSVVIQIVPLCSLNAHCHERLGFRLST